MKHSSNSGEVLMLLALAFFVFSVGFNYQRVAANRDNKQPIKQPINIETQNIEIQKVETQDAVFEENKKEEPEHKIEGVDFEKKAYQFGYENGRKALLQQMGLPYVEENKIEYEYTVLLENLDKHNEEEKKLDEVRQKGYVDGYHKASESLVCPRRDY